MFGIMEYRVYTISYCSADVFVTNNVQVKMCTNIQKVKCSNNPSPPQVHHQVSHTREVSGEEVETAVEAIGRFICHWGNTTQHKVQTTVFVKLHILGRHAHTVLRKTRTGIGVTDEQAPEAIHRARGPNKPANGVEEEDIKNLLDYLFFLL